MSEYLSALPLALLPAGGNFTGGLIAEFFRVSSRLLNLALHAAAGIMLAVVGVEIVSEALAATPAWAIAATSARLGAGAGTGPWMIYAAVSIDLFSDGLMIGTGATIAFGLAFVLALGQSIGDVPEGFAAIATLKNRGSSRSQRLLLSASFALPILLGTTPGFWVLRDQSESVRFAALVFSAGLLTVAAVEEMIAEAHEAT